MKRGFYEGCMGFIRWLWQTARAWPDPGMGLRPGSGVAVFVTFLILLFIVIGLALVAFGFDLHQVDLWIDAQGGWLDAVGTALFKLLLVFVLLMCVAVVAAALFDRKNPERAGIISVIVALLVAWFAVAGLSN